MTFAMLLTILAAAAAGFARTLAWESWGENAPSGSASEGTHVWVTHGLYDRGRELGLVPAAAAGAALGVMAVWEVCEVSLMDAKGVSVQDLAANVAGVLAGAANLDVNYQYVGRASGTRQDGKPWLDVPFVPVNETTYALEFGRGGLAIGYAYLGEPGDLVIGTTSMPVHAGEGGDGSIVPYVGANFPRGFHCAAGLEDGDRLMVGAGYRLLLKRLGIDLSALARDGEVRFGASAFVSYSSIF